MKDAKTISVAGAALATDERAETEFGLARALWARGPADHGRALALAEAARTDVTPGTRERRAIDAWLDAHR